MNVVEDPKYMVRIAFVYANNCDECKTASRIIEEALEDEECAASIYNMFYLDDQTVRFCVNNHISDMPSCIIDLEHKFNGFESFTKEKIRQAISKAKIPIK